MGQSERPGSATSHRPVAYLSMPMKPPTEFTLRRVIAAIAAIGIGVAIYIAIADSSGGAPVCLAGGGGCQTVASSSYSHLAGDQRRRVRDRRLPAATRVGFYAGGPRALRRLRPLAGRFRLQRLPHIPGALQDSRDLPVVRGERRADDGALRSQRNPRHRLRWNRGRFPRARRARPTSTQPEDA